MTKKIKDTKGLVKALAAKAKKKGEHTPGPWTMHKTPYGYEVQASDKYHRVSIAFLGTAGSFTGTGSYTLLDAEAQANAELVARAPAMVEEIKWLKEELEQERAEWTYENVKEVWEIMCKQGGNDDHDEV